MPSVTGLRTSSRSSIEVIVPPYVAVEGPSSVRTQAVAIQGLVRVRLAEPTTFKQIAIEFSGSLMVLPVPVGRSWRPESRIVSMLSHTVLDRKTTLCAGQHEFPFNLALPPDLPCSLPDIGGMARVTYTLRARAVRLGLWPNLACERRMNLVRSYPRESIEFQNVYEAENTWRGKAIYAIALPHRAWAAGDTIMALVKLVPLCKEAVPTELRLSLREDVRIVTNNGPRSFARHVATVTHAVRFEPPECVQAHEHGLEPSTSTIRPRPPDGDGECEWARPSDPGPFSLLIPQRTLPTYRTALITVRHHLDVLVRFAPPASSSSPSPSPTSHSSVSSTFAHTSCSVSLGVRILSNQLLSVARQATLGNREALFGVLPELMALRDADASTLDGEFDGDLPSYENHVQDTIPIGQFHEVPDVSRRSSLDASALTTRSFDSQQSLSFDLRQMSTVPDYGAALGAARAGVVPLSSTLGLPSYAEVAMQQAAMSMQFAR